MPIKTYVLLSSMDSDVPIYQRVTGDQRVKVTKKPFFRPYLRVTYQDENGITRTIRYKSNSTDAEGKVLINQREQIDKLKIEANEPFNQAEYRDLMFRNGSLTTNKVTSQTYLEAYPGIEGFSGTCDDVPVPVYKLLNPGQETKIKNADTRIRVKAANKVADLNLEEARAMIIRLNGSFVETPNTGNAEDDLLECQNMLWEFIDDAEEPGLNAVLKEDKEITIDDKTVVLIGTLVNAEMLSFTADGKVSKKNSKTTKWVEVRQFSPESSLEDIRGMFSDYLNSDEGKKLRNDLEKDFESLKN